LSILNPYLDEIIGIFSVDFDVTYQPLNRYSAYLRFCRWNRNVMEEYVCCL